MPDRDRCRPALLLAVILSLTVGCDRESRTGRGGARAPSARVTPAAPYPIVTFDPALIPDATGPLGDFPSVAFPLEQRILSTRDLARERYYFWVGHGFVPIEGRLHRIRISSNEPRKVSALEVVRAVDALMAARGALRVTDRVIPLEALAALARTPEAASAGFDADTNRSRKVVTYVYRYHGREVWTALSLDGLSLLTVERVAQGS